VTAFAIMLAAAALAFGLARLIRISPIPLLLLSGAGLRWLMDSMGHELPHELIYEMTEIGLAMLVFTAGVELSPRRLRKRARPVLIVGTVQFLALGVAGISTAILLGYDPLTAVYLGCALSASSTLVVVRHLQQRRQMFEPFGRLVLGVLLLQDVFIILLLVALSNSPDGWLAMIAGLARAFGLGALAIACHRWFVPWVCRNLNLDEESLMLGAMAMLFAFSGLAYVLNLPFLVGAFLAGYALSAFPMNGLVRGMLGSISGFFLAIFFISIGFALTMPGWQMLQHCLIFIVVLVLVTVVLVTIVSEIVGYSTRASIESGILLSQTSEFSLLLAVIGVKNGQITPELFSLIALITVTTMTLTPFFSRDNVAWGLMNLHPRYRRGEVQGDALSGHAILLGFGRAGPSTLAALKDDGIQAVVIDDDAAVIRRLIAQGVTCIQGDGSNPRVLAQAYAREARVVLCSMRRTNDVSKALDYLRGTDVKVMVRTFEPFESDSVRAEGGIPVETSPAAAETLLGWIDVNLEVS